jgi:sugar-specific transcriptional regulator TrmB
MGYTEVEKGLLEELMKLDLSKNQAILTLYLMTHGVATVDQILRHTGFNRDQVMQELRQLSSLEIVVEMNEQEQYHALPIQELMDKLVDRKKRQA